MTSLNNLLNSFAETSTSPSKDSPSKLKTLKMKPSVFKDICTAMENTRKIIRPQNMSIDNDRDWELYWEAESDLKSLEETLDENCEIVSVEYWIGSRQYFSKAYKVGKFCFTKIGKTKLTSYYSPTIIDEITEKMKENMVADSYYY